MKIQVLAKEGKMGVGGWGLGAGGWGLGRQRFAFSVRRSAFGIQRLAFGVQSPETVYQCSKVELRTKRQNAER